jgi:hypothetical protein
MDRERLSRDEAAISVENSELRAPGPSRGFSLATLLLIVTLVSLVCGLSALAPGAGLAAGIFALPAFVRTALIARHRSSDRTLDHLTGKLALFFGSLGFVAVFGLASGVCCYAACWGGFVAGASVGQLWESGSYAGLATGMVVGFGIGGIVASVLGYFAITRFGLSIPADEISRVEKGIVAVATCLAVVGGFVLFFRIQ